MKQVIISALLLTLEFLEAETTIMLKGSEAPDEWIILGCHYDAIFSPSTIIQYNIVFVHYLVAYYSWD